MRLKVLGAHVSPFILWGKQKGEKKPKKIKAETARVRNY